jgi:hypothetical protein
VINARRYGFILILLIACREAPPQNAPVQASQEGPKEAAKTSTKQTNEDLPLKVHVVAFDRTTASERPVDLQKKLLGIATAAARAAGLEISEKGDLAAVEMHYLLTNNDRPDPKAAGGLLTWGVMVTLRMEDEMGLAEELSATRKDEAPIRRSAVPDMAKAVSLALRKAAESAFWEVHMQWRYRNASAKRASDGLKVDRPEELWAAMRRLGELGHTQAVPELIRIMESFDKLTGHIAAGVLARLKDPRAVPALVRVIKGATGSKALVFLETLSGMGIPTAKRALKQLSEEHPEQSIRAKASELFADSAD